MWTISNFISLLRIFLSIPTAFALWHGQDTLVIIYCFVASLTDTADGWLARKLNQTTEFGKVIDPLADKIFVFTLVFFLLFQGRFALWLGISVIVRDILILLGGIYATKKLGYVLPSNFLGKLTVTLLGFYVLFILMKFSVIIITIMEFLVLAGLIASFVQYGIRMYKLISSKE